MSHTDHSPQAPGPGDVHDVAARHDPVYDQMYASADFEELRARYRRFVVPVTVAFLAWFLLYVVMCNWAGDVMSRQVAGNVNVALVFGLLQFATTFAIAFVYSRYSSRQLDPLASQLHDEYEAAVAGRKGQG